jgi:hypothetical protein
MKTNYIAEVENKLGLKMETVIKAIEQYNKENCKCGFLPCCKLQMKDTDGVMQEIQVAGGAVIVAPKVKP